MPCEWPESFFFCPAYPAYMDGCACLSDRDSTGNNIFIRLILQVALRRQKESEEKNQPLQAGIRNS